MPAPRGLVQRLDHELHRSGLLPRGGRLLVAVSGGADSVALLRLLNAVNGSDYWGWQLVVGHVEHGIRASASKADARFVKELAQKLGLKFLLRSFKLGKKASEDAAREARLQALGAMVRRVKCDAVVMGHHADDQAETVLLRLMRGCGVGGMAGMLMDAELGGVRICRPLLRMKRRELCSYLEEIRQEWREDLTNASGDYLRNRVRSEIMPAMMNLAAGVVSAIGRTAALSRMAADVVAKEARAVRAAAIIREGKTRVIFAKAVLRPVGWLLCSEVIRWAVLRIGGSTESADFERIAAAVAAAQGAAGGKCVELGGGVRLRVKGPEVIVEREKLR